MKTCPQCGLHYPNENVACFVDNTPLVVFDDPRIGTTLAGRYHLDAVLGEGGMATVYRARDGLGERDHECAVKVMNLTLARDEVVRERFRREARAAGKLAHPNIIEITDDGDTDDGTSYLVMEMLRGEDLGALIARGPVPLERALPIMVQTARALARAHDFEVLHRDLKPENIFLHRAADGAEVVKLLDFGIARSMRDTRLTGIGEVFGTPQYMAPERITSIDAGPAADLYALGVIFFEMLAGRLPFQAPDIPSFFVMHLKEEPPPLGPFAPDAPASLEALVRRLLAKDPSARPVDAHRVRGDLLAVCAEVGVAPPPEPEVDVARAPRSAPAAVDRWAHRTAVFGQMLERAFGPAPPPELARSLTELVELTGVAASLRAERLAAERVLADVEARGREGRQRYGVAMDALGVDASSARDEVRAAHEALAPQTAASAACITTVRQAHKDVIFWEGRSAFREPYPELAAAYREVADRVDTWLRARSAEKLAADEVAARGRVAADLEFQIHELRGALANFEQSVGAEKAEHEAKSLAIGRRVDALEARLTALATQFCAPLRARPELAMLFRELDGQAAA